MNIITGSAALTTPSPINWADVEATVLAYASPGVIAKLQAASDAGRQFAGTWRMLGEIAPGAGRGEMAQRARAEARAADGLDDELMDTIRAELHVSAAEAPEPPVPMAASAQDRR